MTRPLQIGSKTYLLRLTNSGARLTQDLLHKPFGQVILDLQRLDLDVVRGLLYASLRPEQSELKLEDVDVLMDSEGFSLMQTMEALKEVLADYMGAGTKAIEEPKKKAQARGSVQMAS